MKNLVIILLLLVSIAEGVFLWKIGTQEKVFKEYLDGGIEQGKWNIGLTNYDFANIQLEGIEGMFVISRTSESRAEMIYRTPLDFPNVSITVGNEFIEFVSSYDQNETEIMVRDINGDGIPDERWLNTSDGLKKFRFSNIQWEEIE